MVFVRLYGTDQPQIQSFHPVKSSLSLHPHSHRHHFLPEEKNVKAEEKQLEYNI